MAIDTAKKRRRAYVCSIPLPWMRFLVLPISDGEIDAIDRGQLFGAYQSAEASVGDRISGNSYMRTTQDGLSYMFSAITDNSYMYTSISANSYLTG